MVYLVYSCLLTAAALYFAVSNTRNMDKRMPVGRLDKFILPPIALMIVAVLTMPVWILIGTFAFSGEAWWNYIWLAGIQTLNFWLVLYGSGWCIVYNNKGFSYRSSFGRIRQYSFSDVRCMHQIIGDLYLHVGYRHCLIDFQQGWQDFEKTYRNWQSQNGVKTKKKIYRMKAGANLSETPGGIGFFLVYLIFGVLGIGFGFVFLIAGIIWKEIGNIIFGAVWTPGMALIFIPALLAMAYPKKFPKIFRFMWKKSIFDHDNYK